MITPGYGITSTERVLPRLALDFTTAVLDPRVTVTRALNTATRINSSGALEIVNANLPRFDFNPTTLICRGLLIEETRVNIILQSNDFSQAVWSKLNGGAGTAPVLTSGQTDPWGGTNAWRLQANSGGSGGSDYSIIRQTITTNNSPRSLWIKSNTGVNQSIYVGAVVSTSVVTATPTWTRVTPKPVSNSPYFDIGTFPNGSSNTTQNIDILIYGAQCETDSGGAATTFATSYIPTTTTSLTRNADAVSMTGTNFSSWYQAGAGALVVSASMISPQVATSRALVGMSDGTSNARIGFNSFSTLIYGTVRTGGVTQVDLFGTAPSVGSVFTASLAFATNNVGYSLSGGAVTTGSSVTLPTVDRMGIGDPATSGYGNFFNGWVRSVRYYPQRITNAETQAFSK